MKSEPSRHSSGDEAVNVVPSGARLRLWCGDTSGYPGPREEDQALCLMLRLWTGGDAERIERLFGRSAMVREKWQERPDYREHTIKKAIETNSEYYDLATT